MPFATLAGGILILLKPPLLNYVVAVYLILVGAIGLNHMYHFIRWETRSSSALLGGHRTNWSLISAGCDVFATIRRRFSYYLRVSSFTRASGRRMSSKSASIGAPAVGFVLGLVVTYGLADAGPGPASSRILQDALVLRTSVGSGTRVGDEALASFDERFAGGNVKKGSLAGYPHLASLEMGPGAGVLVGGGSVFTPSSAILPTESSDSFAERFAGTTMASLAPVARTSESSWIVQLIGDDTEATALSRFRQLQNKHRAILGIYKPLVVNTTLTPGAPPIWTRVRVGLNSREAADSLCAKLESAGERCVVQRNTIAPSRSWSKENGPKGSTEGQARNRGRERPAMPSKASARPQWPPAVEGASPY
jgi:hypothetical protein